MRPLLILSLTLLLASPSASEEASTTSPIDLCRLEAGSPYEPGSGGVGVEYGKIDVPRALPACHEALELAPNDVPTKYRLGRALLQISSCADGLKFMKEAADTGYAPAQAAFGATFIEEPCGLEVDYAQALDWSMRAAEQGNPEGQNNVGYMYELGLADRLDYAEAVRWYRLAAEQSYVPALRNLAQNLEFGTGCGCDVEEAKHYYRLAAELGDDTSGARLAKLILFHGERRMEDVLEATAFLDRGVANGNVQAAIVLATWERSNGNAERALELFATCRFTDGECSYEIARMIEEGVGIEQNPRLAFDTYLQGAHLGNGKSMVRVGQLYLEGKVVVTEGYEEGEKWLGEAAALGEVEAMLTLGDHYMMRRGDNEHAIYFYQVAAESFGSIEGFLRLAQLHLSLAHFGKAEVYGTIVLEHGDSYQQDRARNLFDVLEKMKEQRGLNSGPVINQGPSV